MERLTFSVLICTYNRHEMLARALTALVDNTTEKPDEIVIVNGGDEQADRTIDQFSGRFGITIRVIKVVNKNLAASRNMGLPYCTGDIVAMTDDDAEVFPDWVTQIKNTHIEHPEAAAVGGDILGGYSAQEFLSRLADVVTFRRHEQPTYVRTLPGVNVGYKREVLQQVGLQDETLFRGEDVDLNWRIKLLGYQLFYQPSIRVIHYHRSTTKHFLQQHYMYGRAYYLVRRKWPDMYCVYPHKFGSIREVLKAVHFVVATAYQPLQYAMQLSGPSDRLRAIPLLFASQIAWKSGMLREMLLARSK